MRLQVQVSDVEANIGSEACVILLMLTIAVTMSGFSFNLESSARKSSITSENVAGESLRDTLERVGYVIFRPLGGSEEVVTDYDRLRFLLGNAQEGDVLSVPTVRGTPPSLEVPPGGRATRIFWN